MRVEIILSDEEGQPSLKVCNCHQPELVCLKLIHADGDSVVVNIDDLRTALRKISVK